MASPLAMVYVLGQWAFLNIRDLIEIKIFVVISSNHFFLFVYGMATVRGGQAFFI